MRFRLTQDEAWDLGACARGDRRAADQHGAACTALDALDAADAEDELLARLETMGVKEPWRLAEPLAAAGVDRQGLDRVAELAGPATGAALGWVAASLTAGRLAIELQESTARMTTLVKAVKSYACMDRGEIVEIDLHEGLETTLAVLGFKLKHTEIKVVRDYDRELPKLTVHGSELNQVWTNLLANAIDALGERGTITGLGLATARRIVVDRARRLAENGKPAGTHDVPGAAHPHRGVGMRRSRWARLSAGPLRACTQGSCRAPYRSRHARSRRP